MDFGTIAQEDVDALFFTDDPQEVRIGIVGVVVGGAVVVVRVGGGDDAVV